MLTRKKIYLFTAIAAVSARVITGIAFSGSLFKYFHLVGGLDMQTLLKFSEWGTHEQALPLWTMHRIVLFLNWFAHGGEHVLLPVYLIQNLLGTIAAVAIADITLHLTGKRRGALAAGVIAAFYLPFLIYEFSILQDSFTTNFTLLAVWATLWARRRHFAGLPALTCAILWSCALNGRPVSLLCAAGLWSWSAWSLWRKKLLKRLVMPLTVLLVILLGISCFNYMHNWSFSPFYQVMHYTRISNAAAGAEPASLWQIATNAIKRFPQLFSAYEPRENQNLYFWCDRLKVLNLFIAPGALLPAACGALAILFASGAYKRRSFQLILLVLATLALPLCAREIIGRYRLMLTPYLIIVSVSGFYALLKLPPRRKSIAVFCAGCCAGISLLSAQSRPRVIPEDFNAWAIALEKSGTADKNAILEAYAEFFNRSRPDSAKAFGVMADRLLFYNELRLAENLIVHGYHHQVQRDIVLYFHGYLAVLQKQPGKAVRLFARIDPEQLTPEMRKTFQQVYTDMQNLLHKR